MSPGRRRRLRILLAEDNASNALLARLTLEDRGHEVQVAVNGDLAVQALAQGGHDGLLMDLEMPVMDGFTAARLIRHGAAGDRHRDIPILAVTGHEPGSVEARCVRAGMDGCFHRPLDFSAIESALAAALERCAPGPRDE